MRLFVLSLSSFLFSALTLSAQETSLKLWYTQPAKEWNEALPVGNGDLGAMIFGGVTNDRIQLNEKSVWSGGPEEFVNPRAKSSLKEVRSLLFDGKYKAAQDLAQATLMGDKKRSSAYQTVGDLHLQFDDSTSTVTDYRRELDLERAMASTSYRLNGTQFIRTVFSSAPDKVIVIHLSADKAGAISFTTSLSRPGNNARIRYENAAILMTEHVNNGNGVHLACRVRIIPSGGVVSSGSDGVRVQNANSVIILISAATDYWNEEPVTLTEKTLKIAEPRSWDSLYERHILDFSKYFNRVSLNLGAANSPSRPTDQRLEAFREGNSDPQLIELHYQFGRYLLISSSRPGGLPANLQGLWADGLTPPWDADYHININIQMNYWPAEITGLSEMHEPFFHFLRELSVDGRKTARDMYGMTGSVAHFTTDAWHFTEPYGRTQWAMWPMGYAWSVQHLWQHYLFSEDKKFLDTLAYPLMKEASAFCLDWLTVNPRTKLLVSGPSISPENTFKTREGEIATMVMGPTMDHMIIRELFRSTIAAGNILNKDLKFTRTLEQALKKLSPTVIASDGRIMEWTEEFEEPEPGHRHISHLYGLFPGNEITLQSSPDLLIAARKTIEHRLSNGGGHTGWSRAWIINFYARLMDGEHALSNLKLLLQKSTLPNLFDNHPPFQIDGNFGAVSGVTEMLIQSHAGEIHVLPALPKEWSKGSIKGICARGGFRVGVEWNDGKVQSITVKSERGNVCRIRYRDRSVTFKTSRGGVYVLDELLKVESQ